MGKQINDRGFPYLLLLPVISVFLCGYVWLFPSRGLAQESKSNEVAVNLAEGRVVICAAKDGIIVATVEAHSEPGSRQPVVVSLSPLRAGVLLGAVEWVQPESTNKPIRLDNELPHLAGAALNNAVDTGNPDSASDIEAIGVSVLERIRQLAGLFFNKINISEDEPLIRLVLVDYVPKYGPEAWSIDYHIRQDSLGNEMWRTRVLRPSYTQLYPPEKGRPHTFVEVRYPPENRATAAPELLDLLRQNDPRLAPMRAANQIQEKSVAFVVDGQSQKSLAASDADFLRAALPATTPPGTKLTMGLVDFDKGFRYLIEPAEPLPPPPADEKREPGAPTLRRKSGS
jgi:hypothetical protein